MHAHFLHHLFVACVFLLSSYMTTDSISFSSVSFYSSLTSLSIVRLSSPSLPACSSFSPSSPSSTSCSPFSRSSSSSSSSKSSSFVFVSAQIPLANLVALPSRVNLASFCVNATEETRVNPQYAGQFKFECGGIWQAQILWALKLNARGGMLINGQRVPVNLRFFNVGFGDNATDVRKVVSIATRVLVNMEFGFFHAALGPWSTAFVLPVAQICEATNTPFFQMGGGAESLFKCPQAGINSTNPDYVPECVGRSTAARRFRWMWAPIDALTTSFAQAYWSAALKQAQTTAIFSSGDLASIAQAQGGVVAAANVKIQVVNTNFQSSPSSPYAVVDAYVSFLSQTYPTLDVLFISTEDQPTAVNFVTALQNRQYTPKMIIMSAFPSSPYFIAAVGGAAQQWFVSAAPWDFRLQIVVDPAAYSNDVWTSSLDTNGVAKADAPLQFALDFYKFFGAYPTVYHGIGIGPAVACQKNFELSLTSTPLNYNATDANGSLVTTRTNAVVSPYAKAVYDGAVLVNEPSIMGLVQWTVYGRLNVGFVVGQVSASPGIYDILQPINSATAPFIYPLPTWAERIYSSGGWKSSENIVVALNTVCLAYIVLLILLVIIKRDAAVMKSSSAVMLLLMLLGACMMLASLYVWRLYETTPTCAAHVWLISIGYNLFFMPIFAKTWRLYLIFMSGKLAVRKISNQRLTVMFVLPALLIEIVLIGIWHGVAPFQAQTVVVDPIRPSYNYDSCIYTPAAHTMFYISIGYKIAVLLFGCGLIVLARNIPSSFNETPLITAALYQTLFSAGLLLPITATDALARETCFLIRSFGIMGSVVICSSVLMLPKLVKLSATLPPSSDGFNRGSWNKTPGGSKGRGLGAGPTTPRTSSHGTNNSREGREGGPSTGGNTITGTSSAPRRATGGNTTLVQPGVLAAAMIAEGARAKDAHQQVGEVEIAPLVSSSSPAIASSSASTPFFSSASTLNGMEYELRRRVRELEAQLLGTAAELNEYKSRMGLQPQPQQLLSQILTSRYAPSSRTPAPASPSVASVLPNSVSVDTSSSSSSSSLATPTATTATATGIAPSTTGASSSASSAATLISTTGSAELEQVHVSVSDSPLPSNSNSSSAGRPVRTYV